MAEMEIAVRGKIRGSFDGGPMTVPLMVGTRMERRSVGGRGGGGGGCGGETGLVEAES